MSDPLSDVERLAIHTGDGLGLRAELRGAETPAGVSDRPTASRTGPRALAVVCHPHPLHGGTMHNHVVGTLFSALPAVGVPTMRFNFRGTSGSEGRHGGGIAERLDVVAAIDTMAARFGPDSRGATGESAAARAIPILLAGYSFGALVALSVDDPRVSGWFAVAPPFTRDDTDEPVAAGDHRPRIIVTGTLDEFAPASDVERLTEGWTGTRVIALPGENHFLATASARIRSEAEAFVDEIADY